MRKKKNPTKSAMNEYLDEDRKDAYDLYSEKGERSLMIQYSSRIAMATECIYSIRSFEHKNMVVN